MNEKLKIERLWHYLQIQDELLIIQVQNNEDIGKYLIVEMTNGKLQINTANENEVHNIIMENNVRIIRQRDENGNYIIPDVEHIIRDKNMDY